MTHTCNPPEQPCAIEACGRHAAGPEDTLWICGDCGKAWIVFVSWVSGCCGEWVGADRVSRRAWRGRIPRISAGERRRRGRVRDRLGL